MTRWMPGPRREYDYILTARDRGERAEFIGRGSPWSRARASASACLQRKTRWVHAARCRTRASACCLEILWSIPFPNCVLDWFGRCWSGRRARWRPASGCAPCSSPWSPSPRPSSSPSPAASPTCAPPPPPRAATTRAPPHPRPPPPSRLRGSGTATGVPSRGGPPSSSAISRGSRTSRDAVNIQALSLHLVALPAMSWSDGSWFLCSCWIQPKSRSTRWRRSSSSTRRSAAPSSTTGLFTRYHLGQSGWVLVWLQVLISFFNWPQGRLSTLLQKTVAFVFSCALWSLFMWRTEQIYRFSYNRMNKSNTMRHCNRHTECFLIDPLFNLFYRKSSRRHCSWLLVARIFFLTECAVASSLLHLIILLKATCAPNTSFLTPGFWFVWWKEKRCNRVWWVYSCPQYLPSIGTSARQDWL
jgi:hypothetical protein